MGYNMLGKIRNVVLIGSMALPGACRLHLGTRADKLQDKPVLAAPVDVYGKGRTVGVNGLEVEVGKSVYFTDKDGKTTGKITYGEHGLEFNTMYKGKQVSVTPLANGDFNLSDGLRLKDIMGADEFANYRNAIDLETMEKLYAVFLEKAKAKKQKDPKDKPTLPP